MILNEPERQQNEAALLNSGATLLERLIPSIRRQNVNAITFTRSKDFPAAPLLHNWRHIWYERQKLNMTKTRPALGSILIGIAALCSCNVASAQAATHFYTITVDYTLSRLSVEARFEYPVKSVTARSRNAGRYLLDVRECGDDTNIRMRNRRMMLPDNGIACLNYTVDLERAAKEHRYAGELAPRNIIASPSFWLWRPELHNETKIHAKFHLPVDVKVSVPWQQLDDSGTEFQLGRSPENASTPAVFGRFDYREIEVPGSTLRVALLEGRKVMNNEAVASWVRATATDVSLAYGRFPNPSPQIVVIPITGSTSAVPFGQVIRDGGETVELTINPDEPIEAYLADWKATHEFSHLMLPYITRDQRWISEGFAQYYQNVLQTQSGAYDETYAWQKIYDGLERGRLARPELSPNEAAADGSRSGSMKVYWSGAAIALMADVELRERSSGKEGLNDVLGRFQSCCLPSQDVWSGPEFFAKLDTLISEPLFMRLYKRYADTAGFPDTSDLLTRLGVSAANGEISLKRNAELRSIRDSITEADGMAAHWRSALFSN